MSLSLKINIYHKHCLEGLLMGAPLLCLLLKRRIKLGATGKGFDEMQRPMINVNPPGC